MSHSTQSIDHRTKCVSMQRLYFKSISRMTDSEAVRYVAETFKVSIQQAEKILS